MDEQATRRRMAEVSLAFAHPLVAEVIGVFALGGMPVQPGVVAAGTQNQFVEPLRAVALEKAMLQLARAILLAEGETESVFGGFFRTPVPTALNPDATINLKTLLAVGVHEFDGSGPFPVGAALHRVGVDAASRAEQVGGVHDD